MNPYKELIHGGDVASLRGRFAVEDLLDFSVNTSPLGLPDSVRRALVAGAEQFAAYPDPWCRELREALARYEAVPPEWLLCGAGAAELIFRIAFALRPRTALLLCPTFGEYELALGQVGCAVDYYALDAAADFAAGDDLPQRAARAELVFLCNPNNPNGRLLEPGLLRRVAEACRESGTVLVVDECFIDLVDEPEAHTLKGLLGGQKRLLLLHAFTKSYALPGLRLGWALCADAALLRALDEAGPSWNVSVPAQLAGVAAAGDRAYLERVRALVRVERPRLRAALEGCGLRVAHSDANYLLFATDDRALADKLCARRVVVRACGNYRGLSEEYCRVAVRRAEENNALVGAIKECLQTCPTS